MGADNLAEQYYTTLPFSHKTEQEIVFRISYRMDVYVLKIANCNYYDG